MSYMTTSERQLSLVTEISAANTRAEFAQALVGAARAYGFRHITLMHAPAPESILFKTLLIETSLPSAYFNQFDRARIMRLPTLSTGMGESALPRSWNLSDNACDSIFPDELSKLLRAFGIPTGVAVPACTRDGERILFWLAGERPPLGQTELNELTMVTLHLLDAYHRTKQSKLMEHPPLSAREREVVRWTAQGKTSIEIGQILSLSDHTVNAYMTSAIKKLDCVNRTQLVAKAIRMKLII
ncbi:DNA-binding CsgD family transcriptional regulator [Rhizobium tibeticum]|uniref:helix-turn-helix transcriptional regulator n=1 Tax=Rhizobium tibeticum TaxID=501024 RepID=UPI00278128DE|nr:LuxR family transcriptional regulator [Rhizobium tibeticum]MDP9812118.1 DNA-binding CsgD family transcriptional regulator [Rhizobium tibeticum]